MYSSLSCRPVSAYTAYLPSASKKRQTSLPNLEFSRIHTSVYVSDLSTPMLSRSVASRILNDEVTLCSLLKPIHFSLLYLYARWETSGKLT